MTLADLAEYLRKRDSFVIFSHEGPDPDGLGAAYALALALGSIGKTVLAVADRIPAKYRFIDRRSLFISANALEDRPAAPSTAIIVDTSDLGYLGARASGFAASAGGLIAIDHHELKAEGGAGLIDPLASSTCELVFLIAKALGVPLQQDAAEAIFAGIVYDTGSFSYPKTSERTFVCALELVRLGVVPSEMHKRMYESSSSGVLMLQKAVLSSLELEAGGHVAVQTLRREDLASTGANYEDAEDLVNIPLQDKSVLVSVFFKESPEGKLRCSLRAKEGINVAHVAQAFGGGGHKTAAGFTCSAPLARSKADVLQSIASILQRT
jgi:Exopolyphosphatase-related proteins